MGSWKIIEILDPRMFRISSRGSFSRSTPWKSTSPEISAYFESVRPMTVRELTLLPEPDSPTMPERLPRLDRVRDPVDRLDDAVVGLEVDPAGP